MLDCNVLGHGITNILSLHLCGLKLESDLMPDVFFDVDAVIIAVQVAQARITAAESSVQIAYLSVNDRVELDIKYADELGRSIASLPILCTCFVFRAH